MEIECRGEEMIYGGRACFDRADEQDHSDLTAEILFKCFDNVHTVRSDFQGIL